MAGLFSPTGNPAARRTPGYRPASVTAHGRPILEEAGFIDVRVEARPEWQDVFTRVYRTALIAGDPAGDTALADLQDEAQRRLKTADLVDRVGATGTRPDPTEHEPAA